MILDSNISFSINSITVALLFSFCIFDPLLDQEEINTMDVYCQKSFDR
jgi:hypothetical protein